jgi:hypothetical protein
VAITSIMYDWGTNPTIIRITTTDDLTTITTAGYWTDEQDNIEALNHGAFDIPLGSIFGIVYDGGEGFFTFDEADQTFVAETNPGSLSETLQENRIFVGNASNVATGVAMSGDIGIVASGETAIQAGVIVNADVNAAAAIAYSKLAALPSAQILVGSAGNVATAVAMSGDVAISNTGATTIQAGAVESSMLDAAVLQYASVTMSAAEFNGAYATPHLLVAAPGADLLLILEQAQFVMTYGGAAFANGGTAAIQYDDTANGAGVIASTTLANTVWQATADTTFTMNAGVVALPFATTVNTGLYFSNISGAFDTGTSDFVVHLWYRVIPTV